MNRSNGDRIDRDDYDDVFDDATPEEREAWIQLKKVFFPAGAPHVSVAIAAQDILLSLLRIFRQLPAGENAQGVSNKALNVAKFALNATAEDAAAFRPWLETAHDQLWHLLTAGGARSRRAGALRLISEAVPITSQVEGEALIFRLVLLDERFRALDYNTLSRLARGTQPRETVRKGGAGKTGPALLAAKLSVAVGAFDDTDVAVAKKRFLSAEQSETR